MEILTDNPINKAIEDKFGYVRYSSIIADTIRETNSLPFCVGIFRIWGTGKTSLMRMIKENVEENEDVEKKDYIKTIWFNPWKYDKKEDLWMALIQTILYKITEECLECEKTRAIELIRSISWQLLKKSLPHLTAGTISETWLDNVKEVIVKEDEKHYRYINYFENEFEEIVHDYTNNGKLIVFIDDLDRCLPENAIIVLESLKLFIGNANCVFVLGMDHNIVEEGIKIRLGENIKISGREYLDKIIQVPFYLPPVPFVKLQETLKADITADGSENIWKLIRLGFGVNPRKTKRFVNSFNLSRKILQLQQSENVSPINDSSLEQATQDFYLAKLLIFQMNFTDFYFHLQQHPDAWRIFENSSARNILEGGKIVAEDPALTKFWQNESLKYFTEINPSNKFPHPPDSEMVLALINAINLVSPVHNSNFSGN